MTSTWRKLLLLTSLYFSQGLPYGFFTQALPVLLRLQGASLPQIGLAQLLALPWALKFLWAPWLDRRAPSTHGKHRSVIVPLQIAAAVVLGVVAFFPASKTIQPLLVAVLVVNLLSATQDIATDALAVSMLAEHERGLGNGIQVAGYRLGMIVGGGALLMAMSLLGWAGTFVGMGLMVLAATLPILGFREAKHDEVKPITGSFWSELLVWFSSPGRRAWLGLLVAFKSGEALASGMLRPFLVDAGLTLAEIGAWLGTLGFTLGLIGAMLGGALVQRLGRRTSLVTFGLLQSVSIACLGAVAWVALKPTIPNALETSPELVASVASVASMSSNVRIALVATCALEHLTSGIATAALFTAMMDASRPEHAATDYTLQACAVVIATGGAAAVSGVIAQRVGFPMHFAIAAGVSVLGALFAAGVKTRDTSLPLAR